MSRIFQDSPPDDKNLSMTSFAVLGLLQGGEISGYDLLKQAKLKMGSIWEPTKSHVYRELKRLVLRGLATERNVEQERRPDKRIFKITPAGASEFMGWMENSKLENESVRSPFMLQFFFGEQIDRRLMIQRLEKYRAQVATELQHYTALSAELKGKSDQLVPLLSLRAAVHRRHALLAWVDEAAHALRSP